MMSFADQVITHRAALDDCHRPRQPRTLAAMLDSVAGQYPDRPFVITAQGTLSYAEPAGWSARLARRLAASGVRPGDHRRDGE